MKGGLTVGRVLSAKTPLWGAEKERLIGAGKISSWRHRVTTLSFKHMELANTRRQSRDYKGEKC